MNRSLLILLILSLSILDLLRAESTKASNPNPNKTLPAADHITPAPQTKQALWEQLALGLTETDSESLSPDQQKQLEAILNEELNSLRPNSLVVDPPTDDVSDGSIGQPLADELATIQRARAIIDKLKQTGNFLLKLTGKDLLTFPVGISQKIGNVEYTLAVGGMKLRTTHAELEVYLEINAPGKTPLLFGTPNLKFTKDGGIVGDACLGLISDFAVDIVKHKSVLKLRKAEVNENGSCSTGTYVNIDCDGFKSLSIDAEVIFSRDWIKPPDPNNTGRVTGEFLTQVSSWEDILIAIDMDDFVINNLEDVEFRVDTVVLDFSDTKIYSGINFPPNYVHPLKDTPLWQGFYMAQFRVFLPERLAGGTGKFIDGQGVIIDDSGFTGKVSAYPNLINLGEADLNGWAFSVDTFRIDILQQQFQEVKVAGKINIPIFGKEEGGAPRPADCFSYAAMITVGNIYNFHVSPEQNYEVSMWKASAEIYQNSSLNILFANGDVEVDALIHGKISLDGDFGDNLNISIPEIPFDSMAIANHGDYFSPGNWDLPTSITAQIGNFTLGIHELKVEKQVEGGLTTAGITFDLNVVLDGDLEIDATGGLSITAELDRGGDYHRWKVRNFGLTSFYYEGDFVGVDHLSVGLEIYSDDPDYGSGFRGIGGVKFKELILKSKP